MPGATKKHFVPQPDASVYLIIDIIPRQQLVFIEPAPYASTLQKIVQSTRKGLVFMAITDEA